MALTHSLLALGMALPAASMENVWTLGAPTAQTCNVVCASQPVPHTCVGLAWPSTHSIMENVAASMSLNPCTSYAPAVDRHTTVGGSAPYADNFGNCFFYAQGSCSTPKTAGGVNLICPCMHIPEHARGRLQNGALDAHAISWLAAGNNLESLPARIGDANALGAETAQGFFKKFQLQHVTLPRTSSRLAKVVVAASAALAFVVLVTGLVVSTHRRRQHVVELLPAASAAE